MYQNYFIVNGGKYCTGTIFIIKDRDKQKEASFICYDTIHSLLIYKIENCTYRAYNKYFYDHFITVTNKIDPSARMPISKQMKDSKVDGLFLGWIWYIFLMTISVIFKDVIGLWVFISIIFFSWRHKKIKKEGTYIEW